MASRFISFFKDGNGSKETLGNKGYSLHKMSRLGLPVPEGFTISVDGYHYWKDFGLQGQLQDELLEALVELEQKTGKTFDSSEDPLLVSIRSGAPISMPGMMETILNVGANARTIQALSAHGEDFAYDIFRNFLDRYAQVVNEHEEHERMLSAIFPPFIVWIDTYVSSKENIYEISDLVLKGISDKIAPQRIIEKIPSYIPLRSLHRLPDNCSLEHMPIISKYGHTGIIERHAQKFAQVHWDGGDEESIDLERSGEDLSLTPAVHKVVTEFMENVYAQHDPKMQALLLRKRIPEHIIPDDPLIQISQAIEAVFSSWNSEKAKTFRSLSNIPDYIGTAINVQRMVYGNKNAQSGTAVLFSSHPTTAEPLIIGEAAIQHQGEDIVGGHVKPISLQDLPVHVYAQLSHMARDVELRTQDIQDMEFTWEDGKVFALQTRKALLNPLGHLRFLLREYHAQDMSGQEIFKRLSKSDLEGILQADQLDVENGAKALLKGISLSPQIASGALIKDTQDAMHFSNMEFILCTPLLDTDDVALISASKGIITSAQNAYSHAAVIARGLGKAVLVGCDMQLIGKDKVRLGDSYHSLGEIVTIDGNTGMLYEGMVSHLHASKTPELHELAFIAKKTLPKKPLVYEVQCLEDLAFIQDPSLPVLYSIDYDCAKYSGALEGIRLPKEELELRAYDVGAALGDRLILKVSNMFDEWMENPDPIKRAYLKTFNPSTLFWNDDAQAHLLLPWQEETSMIQLAWEAYHEP